MSVKSTVSVAVILNSPTVDRFFTPQRRISLENQHGGPATARRPPPSILLTHKAQCDRNRHG